MEKDKHITEVMLRIGTVGDWKGEVFALFPYIIADNSGDVDSFTPYEGHSAADYYHCLRKSKPLIGVEKDNLIKCLEDNYGYNLKEVKKRSHSKYIKAFKESRK